MAEQTGGFARTPRCTNDVNAARTRLRATRAAPPPAELDAAVRKRFTESETRVLHFIPTVSQTRRASEVHLCWRARTGVALLTLLAASALAPALAAEQGVVYAPVRPGRVLSFPHDHSTHPRFRNEWWYITGW